jgi:hypothetical protein
MSRRASPNDVRQPSCLLLTSALALALIALPVGMSADGPFLDWQTASAKGPGGNGPGGGHGGGPGNGRGNGHGEHGRGLGQQKGLDGNGWAYGRGRGPDGRGGVAGGPRDLNEFLDGVRSGRSFGLERRDERIDAAKGRYREAFGRPGQGLGRAEGARTVAYGFSLDETTTLIERGWRGPKAQSDGFRNHGERVRTMVELSKRLGYGAHVGALQANFGTPFENGIAELQAQLAAAEQAGDEAEAERLRGELAAAIAEAKPGAGPDDGWATADLDVNDDQLVDRRDLEALAQADEERLAEQGS